MNLSFSESPVPSAEQLPWEWRAFAVRRGVAFALLFGWLPFCAALFLLSAKWLNEPGWSILAMVVWLFAAFAAVWYAGEFRCPRCRRRYAALGHNQTVNLTRGLFDKICSNCKLAKFEGYERSRRTP